MARKIDFTTLSSTAVMNLRISMYPAEKRLQEYKLVAAILEEEKEEVTVMTEAEIAGVTYLNERLVSRQAYWENVLKEKQDALRALFDKDFMADLKKAADPDDLTTFDKVVWSWFRKNGVDLVPGRDDAPFHKAFEAILMASNRILKVNSKGDLVVAGSKSVRINLAYAMINYLAFGRKQFEVCGTKNEPVFRLRTFEEA